jgi:hypothetical protein
MVFAVGLQVMGLLFHVGSTGKEDENDDLLVFGLLFLAGASAAVLQFVEEGI